MTTTHGLTHPPPPPRLSGNYNYFCAVNLVLEVTAAGLIKPASVFDVLRTDAYDFEALALKEGQTELGQASVKLRDRIIVESFVVFQVVLYLAQQVYEYRKTKKATGSAMAYLKSWYESLAPRLIRTTTGLSYRSQSPHTGR